MGNVRLEDATINVDGEWLSVNDLKRMISQKMDSGDMKFAGLAAALEALNTALENTHILEETLIVSKEEYAKLKEMGGEDDQDCVRKAIMAYIGRSKEPHKTDEMVMDEKTVIKCSKCKELIQIPSKERPIVFDCPKCGTSCRLTL